MNTNFNLAFNGKTLEKTFGGNPGVVPVIVIGGAIAYSIYGWAKLIYYIGSNLNRMADELDRNERNRNPEDEGPGER